MLSAARSKAFDRTTLAFVTVVLTATALRIWALRLAPLNLYHDEAEFWSWSHAPAWGYASAPPMVAWAISVATHFLGDAEWAVRLGAPLAQALAALGLYALGRNVYGAWVGFWTGVAWLLTPGVWYSSNLISSDVLVLPFWTLALTALWRMVQTRAMAWAVLLGAALGGGLNASYTALYFPLCVFAAARWSQPVREALNGGRGVTALLIALALIAPNLAWNTQHGFATFQETVAHFGIDAANLFNVNKIVEFMTGQALLLGPIAFFVLLGLFARASNRAGGLSDEDRFLLAFTLPPLTIVTVFAVVTHADANWAAIAYPAALTWIAGALLGGANERRVFAAALISNVVIGGVIAFSFLHPGSSGVMRGMRESTGWAETARAVALRATPLRGERPFSAVLVDDRAAYFQLNYYWTRVGAAAGPLPPLRVWQLLGSARAPIDGEPALDTRAGARVLVVHTAPAFIPFVAGDFTTFRSVEDLSVPLGAGAARSLELSVGEGFAPARRDAAFMERLNNRRTGPAS